MGSHYVSAVREDPEQLEALYNAGQLTPGDDGTAWAPPDQGWTLQLELLATLCDLVAAVGGGGDKWSFPRPKHLADDLREALRIEAAKDAFADAGLPLL